MLVFFARLCIRRKSMATALAAKLFVFLPPLVDIGNKHEKITVALLFPFKSPLIGYISLHEENVGR